MRIKRIHVNQHNIKWNTKNSTQSPKPIMTVKCGGKTYVGQKVDINGPSCVVYSPDKPLSCGAHVWIETNADICIDGVILT